MATRILVNLNGHTFTGARRETWNGRRYIVVPIAMIVPGVLPGSQGALLYPSQEVARNVRDWDGIAITVNHPSDPISNHHLSARAQGVWKRQGIGRVRNTVFNGKLRCEGWFDEERTRRIDNRIVTALLNNKTMEVSTGLYTDNEPQRGEWNGRQYDFIARNYRPDHLAVLPDQVGACSRQDGCGIHVNAKKCKCGGTCDDCKAPTDEQGMTKNMRRSFWRWFGEAMGLTSNDGPDTSSFQRTALSAGSSRSTTAAASQTSGQSGTTFRQDAPAPAATTPAADADDDDTTDNAHRQCPECDGDMEDGECDECGYVENSNPEGHNQYSKGSNSLSKSAESASRVADSGGKRSDHRVARDAHRKAADAHSEAGDMDKAAHHTKMSEKHASAALTSKPTGGATHETTKSKEADEWSKTHTRSGGHVMNWLALLSDDPKLTCNMPAGGAFSGAQAAGYSAAQAAAMAGKLEGSYDSSGETGKGGSKGTAHAKEASEHAEKTKSKSAHKKAAELHRTAAEYHKGEGNTEMASSHASAARSHAAKAARMSRNEAGGTGGGDIQAGGEEDADGADDPSDYESDAGNLDPNKSKKKAKMPTGNSEVQNYASELYNREKKQLVQQLTANMRDPSRKQLAVRRFSQKGLGELRELIELLPPTGNVRRHTSSPEENTDYTQNYLGAGIVVDGGDGGRRIDSSASDDLLEPPTINFAEVAAENFGRKARA